MIIPSIDMQQGNAVQLVGGKEKVFDGGDPRRWAKEFSLASETAVIDLDAALGVGTNKSIILELIGQYACRVGGGIRTIAYAKELLQAGARKIIVGTKATPDFLSQLPKGRIIAALDAKHGTVVVEGWGVSTHSVVEDKIKELKEYVSGFLVTFVETEGSLKGIDVARCIELKKLCPDVSLTVAGGVQSTREIAALDAAGIDVQVGMALYTGKFSYADAVIAPIAEKIPDGLWPTVVCDERGTALGLTWSNRESVKAAMDEQRGIYYSRSRQSLWKKGDTSGAIQTLKRIDLDCDRDCLRFTVSQNGGGFCHNQTYTCWGEPSGIMKLERTLVDRQLQPVPDSYSQRLFSDEELLKAKVIEETYEFTSADCKNNVISEAADLFYFAMAYLTKNNISFSAVENELDKRSLQIIRQRGDKKTLPVQKTFVQKEGSI